MKKLLITGVALAGLTCGAFAQGWFNLDNTAGTYQNGYAISTAGNYYTGAGGIEVWEANAATGAQISAINSSLSGVAAYGILAGFTKEATFSGISFSFGAVGLGAVKMADVSPAGGTVTVALTAWNTADASASAAILNNTAASRLGVFAFTQKTTDYSTPPVPLPSDLAWGNGVASADLVMTPIPEPGTFALAGLGAAALLIFRRRK